MSREILPVWHGRCLCGAVRYEVNASPLKTSFCHCEDCRRASGAPLVAWTFFPAGTIHFIQGAPSALHHAARERTFCRDCGTPLTFFDPLIPGEFEVTTCSLDDPGIAPAPAEHEWTCDALPWLHVNDDLPVIERSTPPAA